MGFDLILVIGRIPVVVYSDKGSEFNYPMFKVFLKKRHVKYFTTQNEDIKVSLAERVIRTLCNKMHNRNFLWQRIAESKQERHRPGSMGY